MVKIATITLNPAYDLIGSINAIEISEVNKIDSTGYYPAGKGINVAKVLTNLGITPLVTGFYGTENHYGFDAEFIRLGIENKFFEVPGKTRINVKITERTGLTTDLNFSGFEITEEQWLQFSQATLDMFKNYEYVAVCGSVPKGIQLQAYAKWLTDLQSNDTKVILDTSGTALLEGLNAKPWLIKPNIRELESLVNRKLNTPAQILEIARMINKQGITNVIISMGAQGSYWITRDFEYQAIPPKINHVVSTVGAGDSMVAGLIYGLIRQHKPQDCLALATAISAYACTQGNVGIDNMRNVETLKKKTTVTKISA